MTAARSPRPGRPPVATTLALALVVARGAAATDFQVDATTYGQAYQIRGPAGAAVISSRRVTQTLGLTVVDRPRDRRGVTITFRARLRMDADFGEACDPATGRCLDETNRDRGSEFQPLFARRTMDVPYAYLELAGLGRGAVDLRIGRIFQSDVLGFFVFDGARARWHIADRLVAEAYGGLETRAGFPLSSGRFERDGLIRVDRGSWDPSLVPYVLDRQMAPSLGVALETEQLEPVSARLVYRRVWSGDQVVEDKVGGAIQARIERVRLALDAVYSVPERWLSLTTGVVEWSERGGSRAGLELSRYRPTFDVSSIWASFWTDPTDDARVYGEWALTPRWSLTGSWLLRRYALSETGARNGLPQGDLWNTGGAAGVLLRAPSHAASFRARVEGGAVGPRAGLDADGYWWAVPDRLRVDARFSLWHVEDDLRPERSGFSVGGVVGATLRFGTIADVHFDVEDDVNRLVGHRFRVMGIFTLRGTL